MLYTAELIGASSIISCEHPPDTLLSVYSSSESTCEDDVCVCQEGGWTGMGSGSAPVPGQDGVGGDGDGGMPEWDDDDLVAMQAEPMVTFCCHCNVQTSQQGLGKASPALSARK